MRVKAYVTLIFVLLILLTPFAVGGVPIPSKLDDVAVTIVGFIRFWLTTLQEFIRFWLKLTRPP